MAVRNGTFKRYNAVSGEFDVINFSTTMNQVDGLTTALAGKQATLVSGTNIKTINGNSILGSGNLTISATIPYATTAQAKAGTSTTTVISPKLLRDATSQNLASLLASLPNI